MYRLLPVCPPQHLIASANFMRRAVLGLENEALTDPDLWLCTTLLQLFRPAVRGTLSRRCHHDP